MNNNITMPIASSPWVTHHRSEKVNNFERWYRAKAASLAHLLDQAESKTADSFMAGAVQAMSPYGITTHAHKVLSGSTFRFSEMKDGPKPVNVSIIVDSTQLHTQSKIAGLLQWCALTELRLHPNTHKPVYLIGDEITNYHIKDIDKTMTYGREYGLRLHLFIQSRSAFRKTYGEEALNVLDSETEIKQFLPGQREPATLELIEKLLGEQSYMARSGSGSSDKFGVYGFGLNEEARKLMTADEIRRTDKAILFIRKCRPVLTKLPPYAAIHPWRIQVADNPFYDKPFKKRISLRIGNRKGALLLRPFRYARKQVIKGKDAVAAYLRQKQRSVKQRMTQTIKRLFGRNGGQS